MFIFSDLPLGQQVAASYDAAFTTRTHKNKIRQTQYYLTYALSYGINTLHPSVPEACMYIQFLANSLTCPRSRRNYVSGAKHYILDHAGDPSNLFSPEANAVAKGAARLKPHTPNPAAPLTPDELVYTCIYIDTFNLGLEVKAALLFAYFGFLRSSNTVSPTQTDWGGPHTLKRQDIIRHPGGLYVVIHSSKTLQVYDDPVTLALPSIPGCPACPTSAWDLYTSYTPGAPTDPAFVTPDGLPLTNGPIVKAMRDCATKRGWDPARRLSMHSLRRGGARGAKLAGASDLDIASHGTWKSDKGYRAYVPNSSSITTSDKLSSLFAYK